MDYKISYSKHHFPLDRFNAQVYGSDNREVDTMTQEFIASLRAAQKRREEFEEEQKKALEAWDEKNLDPIRDACDHKYPWGDSALLPSNSPGDDEYCQICYRRVW